jgi:hypothetical protein
MIGDTLSQYTPSATVDEIHISNVVRSAGWLKTQYNNQISPSTFYTVVSAAIGQ